MIHGVLGCCIQLSLVLLLLSHAIIVCPDSSPCSSARVSVVDLPLQSLLCCSAPPLLATLLRVSGSVCCTLRISVRSPRVALHCGVGITRLLLYVIFIKSWLLLLLQLRLQLLQSLLLRTDAARRDEIGIVWPRAPRHCHTDLSAG